ncbi:head GIN domain-containing protein [Qipengyuania sp.]|uniref:head GIN domain-containing protein n=1 Tax=Qipengyuania sp. TaxID=2004515 RepID=UPI0037367636
MQRPFFMTLRKLATKCITQVQHAVGVNVMQVLWQFRAGTIALGAVALAACGANAASYGTDEGVPLANLDRSGAAPTGIALAGVDRVIVTSGAAYEINVSGDPEAVAALRFKIEDGTLEIGRKRGQSSGKALVRVSLPRVQGLALAGSGMIEARGIEDAADIALAGSGTVKAMNVAARELSIAINGSGDVLAAGTARQLDISIAGSGSAMMPQLRTEQGSVSIMGSGDAEFASDGEVAASIAGSGNVTVRGAARCTLSKAGSGDLHCGPGRD